MPTHVTLIFSKEHNANSQYGDYLTFWRYSIHVENFYFKFKMIKTSSKPCGCSIPMTNGKFITNMAFQLKSLSLSRRNMKLLVKVRQVANSCRNTISPLR